MIGQLGEDKATELLQAQGLKLVERNYRCRAGEADIIVSDGKTLMFVEVKARSSDAFGMPAEAIGRKKLRRMQRVAESFLIEREIAAPIRFGVVVILGENPPELITEIEAID